MAGHLTASGRTGPGSEPDDGGRATGAHRAATIHDVAKHAGVSIKTVSRVLNDEPNVRSQTREQVRRAIAALDYEPHPAARGLAGRRTRSIGLLYENPHEFSYIQRLLEGAYAACESNGHALMLRPCADDLSPSDVRQFVRQTRVDGLLLTAPIADRSDITSLLVDTGTAFVQVSPRTVNPQWSSVSPDDVEAGRALTAHVLSLGHRRIGFVKGDPRHGASGKRLDGYLECLDDHGLPVDTALIVDGRFDFDSGKRGCLALMRLADPPSAIIASNDDTAAGVVVTAHEAGIDIPNELSVAGFDDSPTALHTWPSLTTVRQPIAAMAFRATELLIAGLAGDATPRQETFDCELIARSSMAEPDQLRKPST